MNYAWLAVVWFKLAYMPTLPDTVAIPWPTIPGADLGVHPPPPTPDMACSFLIQLVFCKKKNYVVYWCWSRARDECTPPQKNPGSAPAYRSPNLFWASLCFGLELSPFFQKNSFDSWYMVHFACILSLTKILLFGQVNFDGMYFM